jgi:hypothetical protein
MFTLIALFVLNMNLVNLMPLGCWSHKLFFIGLTNFILFFTIWHLDEEDMWS